MSDALSIILPLLLMVLTGFVAGTGKWLDLAAARILARFVFLFAMPVAVFSFYIGATPPGIEVIGFLGAYFIAMVINISVAFWSGKKFLGLKTREAGAHSFVTTCGNAVFLGLPIALSIEGWGQAFLFLMILEGTFVFGICAALMSWEKTADNGQGRIAQLGSGIAKSLVLPFKNPIVVASLLGLAFTFTGWSFPDPVQAYFDRFGAVAAATGLFVLGLYMAVLPRDEMRRFIPNVTQGSFIKLVFFPVVAGGLIWLFTGGNTTLVGAGVLFTAMPSAVASIVQASHYRLYEHETTGIVTLTSPVSLLTMILVLVLFAG